MYQMVHLGYLPNGNDRIEDVPASMVGVKELEYQIMALQFLVMDMCATLSGCDWCCGGGDRHRMELEDTINYLEGYRKNLLEVIWSTSSSGDRAL